MPTDNEEELIFEDVIDGGQSAPVPSQPQQSYPEELNYPQGGGGQSSQDEGNQDGPDGSSAGSGGGGGGGSSGGGSASTANPAYHTAADAAAKQFMANTADARKKVSLKKIGAAVASAPAKVPVISDTPSAPAGRVVRSIKNPGTTTVTTGTGRSISQAAKGNTAAPKSRSVAHGEDCFDIHQRRKIASTVGWELGEDTANATFAADPSFAGALGTIVWESDVYDYLDSTDAQVRSIKRDIEAAGDKLPADFLASWAGFVSEWDELYKKERADSHTFDGVTIMNKVDSYVERLKGYQTKMQALGVAKNVPSIMTSVDSVFNKSALTGPQMGLIAAVAGIGTVVGFKVLKTLL